MNTQIDEPDWNEVQTVVLLLNGQIVATTGIPRCDPYGRWSS